MSPHKQFLVIGAGFSGAVLSRELVERMKARVTTFDERSHIAGNCHTERDGSTGIMLHKYGPHIFNTNNQRVWDYVNSHDEIRPFVNRVKAVNSRGVFSLPINLHTINQFFGKTFSPDEAREFIASLGDDTIDEPQNFEEQVLKFLGEDLYKAFFLGYTIKQWGCMPTELPAAVIKRLPVRFNYDDNYYNKRYQGIPVSGYSAVVESILDHPSIEVILDRKWRPVDGSEGYDHVFYTGPIDAYFDHCEGRLGYRTVTFERCDTTASDYQGNAVINYTEESVPFTRIHEHKHFTPWESHDKTVAFKEFSKETEDHDIPYYPKRLAVDKDLLKKYRTMAEKLVGVSFLGRLATYRYMDMDTVIGEALDFADDLVKRIKAGKAPSVFPNAEKTQ